MKLLTFYTSMPNKPEYVINRVLSNINPVNSAETTAPDAVPTAIPAAVPINVSDVAPMAAAPARVHRRHQLLTKFLDTVATKKASEP